MSSGMGKPAKPRNGWESASRELAKSGDDKLAWPEFGNAADRELTWQVVAPKPRRAASARS
jgi:hypothetical protein